MAKDTKKKQAQQEPDYKDNIANYIDEFRKYKTFSEAVRHLPGMYIGATGNIGWKACIREIFQNSIDEMIKKESPCNEVTLCFNESDQSASVQDNGRGIPHGHIIDIYTSAHMSTNFEETKKPFEYSSGTHGVGGGVAMALSEEMEIDSTIFGKCHQVRFHRGEPWKAGEKEIKASSDFPQGTYIYLKPDVDIIGQTNLTVDEIFSSLVMKIFPLIPIGYKINFFGQRYDGSKLEQHLVNTDGIKGTLARKVTKPLISPIEFEQDTGTMRVHVVFTYDPTDMNDKEDIDSYANYTPCDGAHVQGFLEGLTSYFMAYMNKIYLKNAKITVNSTDIKTGLKAVIDADHLHPTFEGQGKVAINNQDLRKFVSDLTKKAIDAWAKVNPNELNKLGKYFKDIAEIRAKLETGKTKLSNNYSKSIISGDPAKYVKPTGTKHLELFIVEGDSALGSAKSCRDSKSQSLYPIRGKLINTFGKSKAEVFKNEEIASITKIITGLDHYDPNFDANKSRYDKIIFMADGDPDGSHIKTLLLRFFLMYFPDFIKKGKVYAAVPPLFGLKKGGKVIKYFTTNAEVAKYVQNQFGKIHVIEDKTTKKKLSNNDIIRLFAINMDYTEIIDRDAAVCGVHPKLLEDILIQIADDIEFSSRTNEYFAMAKARFSVAAIDKATLTGFIDEGVQFDLKNFKIEALKKRIESKYRFMHVSIVNGHIVFEGLAYDKQQRIIIGEQFIRNCYDAIKLIAKNDRAYFRVDGKVISLYELMSMANAMMPNLKRYKGLGEQNPSELKESTMGIENRTLIQYTMDSAKEEIEMIRIIDEDRGSLLRGITITKQDIE